MARVQAGGLLCDGLPHDGRPASWPPASAALRADRAPTPQVAKPRAVPSSDQRIVNPGSQPPCNECCPSPTRAPAQPLSLVPARIWHDQALQAASEPARAMERHDWAPGSRDCGRAQITQICAHTGCTLTRQSAASQLGGYRVSHDRGAVTVGNEARVWPSPTPGSATATSWATSRSDQHHHARLRLVTRFSPSMSELGRGWPDGPVSDSVQGPDAADGQVRGLRFTEPMGGSMKRATILVPVG
jgi:hypothetical protein